MTRDEQIKRAAIKSTCDYYTDQEIDDIIVGEKHLHQPDESYPVQDFEDGVHWCEKHLPNLNLNVAVKVTLTERGAKVINGHNKDFIAYVAGLGMSKEYVEKLANNMKHDYVAGDEYKCQLWEIMQIFGGKHIGMGIDVPFLKNEIEFVD